MFTKVFVPKEEVSFLILQESCCWDCFETWAKGARRSTNIQITLKHFLFQQKESGFFVIRNLSSSPPLVKGFNRLLVHLLLFPGNQGTNRKDMPLGLIHCRMEKMKLWIFSRMTERGEIREYSPPYLRQEPYKPDDCTSCAPRPGKYKQFFALMWREVDFAARRQALITHEQRWSGAALTPVRILPASLSPLTARSPQSKHHKVYRFILTKHLKRRVLNNPKLSRLKRRETRSSQGTSLWL